MAQSLRGNRHKYAAFSHIFPTGLPIKPASSLLLVSRLLSFRPPSKLCAFCTAFRLRCLRFAHFPHEQYLHTPFTLKMQNYGKMPIHSKLSTKGARLISIPRPLFAHSRCLNFSTPACNVRFKGGVIFRGTERGVIFRGTLYILRCIIYKGCFILYERFVKFFSFHN